jgi:arylsulfatase A-like enzyme
VFPLAFGDPRRPLQGWLRRRGMRTVAVTDDGFSEMLSRGVGIEREFDDYFETDELEQHRNDTGTADNAIRVLDEHKGEQRLFLWVHFFGTHDPNSVHAEAKVYGSSLSDGYNHEINFLDMQVGRLFRRLEAWPRPLAIFFSSDHGDLFGKIRYHAYSMTDPIARVPLIAKLPGWKPGRSRVPVSLIDLAPTILELTKTPAPGYLQGEPLQKLMKPARGAPERVLYSDTWVYTAEGKPRVMITSAYNSTGKVLFDHVTQTRRSERALTGAEDKRNYNELSSALDAYLERTGGALHLDSDG